VPDSLEERVPFSSELNSSILASLSWACSCWSWKRGFLSVALLYSTFFPGGPLHAKQNAFDPLPEI
jgi:hypothetical protein